MATNIVRHSSSVVVGEFLECSICTTEFDLDKRKPKHLPCAHTLCLQCIHDWTTVGNKTCPICRARFSVPHNRVEQLPNNIIINALLNQVPVVRVDAWTRKGQKTEVNVKKINFVAQRPIKTIYVVLIIVLITLLAAVITIFTSSIIT